MLRQDNFEANVHMLKEQKCIDLIVVKIFESKLIVVEPLYYRCIVKLSASF